MGLMACAGSQHDKDARDGAQDEEPDAQRPDDDLDAGETSKDDDAGAKSDAARATSDAGLDASPEDMSCTASDAGTRPFAQNAPEKSPDAATRGWFTLQLRSSDGGTPVRGARVHTISKVEYRSDDNGNVAFDEPGQAGLDVFFHVEHPGFELAADAFGYRGRALRVSEGGRGEIVMTPTTGEQGPSVGDLQTRLLAQPAASGDRCFAMRALDQESGRGVPLVRFSAFGEDYWSDSQGMVAYCHPDHLGADVVFTVNSHGYKLADGKSDVTLRAAKATTAKVSLVRALAAQRLYRITGSGIYRDSVMLGLKVPTKQPLLNGQVIGSDTSTSTLYRGKLFWLWQDTDRLSYPLGNFLGTVATSELPSAGGLSADKGVDLSYFTRSDGFAKEISEAFKPDGPVWMAGLTSVPDAQGQEQLFASYSKMDGLNAVEAGLMRWNAQRQLFERVVTDLLAREKSTPGFVRPDNYASKFTTSDGVEAVYYANRLRIPANAETMVKLEQYQRFTPFGADGSDALLKTPAGALDYAYRRAGRHVTSDQLRTLNVPSAQDLDGHVHALSTGSAVTLVQGHSVFNAYRRRFVRQAQEFGAWGELYHAEADTPEGPWVYAEKVVTHNAYNFYNPSPHPELAQLDGRLVFFEGSYTTFLFDQTTPTPRYDYNQIMYRLDLDDARVILPVPVYDLGGATPGDFVLKEQLRPGSERLSAPMMAFDRPKPGSLPLRWSLGRCAPDRRLVVGKEPAPGDAFYALPPDDNRPNTRPLYEYASKDGRFAYSVDAALSLSGFTRASKALARVYENPIQVALPVRDFLGPLIADAGDDRCLMLSDQKTVKVALDATKSSARTGNITSYTWTVDGDGASCKKFTGARVTLELGAGTHVVQLEVRTEDKSVARDSVLISVSAP